MINKIEEFLKSNIYGCLIFCALLLFMMSHPQRSLDVDCLCSFTIDYKTGFGGRKLVASIVSLFFNPINHSRLLKLIYLLSILGCFFFSFCCNIFIKKAKTYGFDDYISSIYLVTLYIMCPASILFLLVFPNFGRLDLILYLSCLVFCFLFYHREKNRLIYFLSVASLIVLNILSHHIFVVTYLSFFVSMFIYDIWSKGFNKKLFAAYFILGIITIATFLSVILFSSMNVTLNEATHYHPNIELNRKFVWFIYYAHIPEHIQLYVLPNLKKLVIGFILTIFFLLPLIGFVVKIWKNTLKEQESTSKNLFWTMQSSFLLFVPAFCITVDHARWFSSYIFLQFLLLAYFSFDKNSLYSNIGKTISIFIQRHIFLAALLIIYCSLLGLFGSDRTFECGEFILDKIHIYKNIIQLPVGI